jgi:uroporphyrinogen-III decarboxylase
VTPREHFFRVLNGQPVERAPFFPDISTWYQAARLGVGAEQPYFPGQYIPDDSPLHAQPGTLEGRLARLTYRDFYREFGWGLPAHMYDWFEEVYSGGVEKMVHTSGQHRSVTWRTARGELRRTYKLDAEGTWSEYGHMVKDLGELDIVRAIVEHTRFVPRYERVERFLRETEGFGVCDIGLYRSPFGKLIHEYLGFEAVAYALFDHEPAVLDFLAFQEHYDLAFAELAAAAPGSIVILSDHADENLIAPPWYRRFCMPYYRKACAIIHRAGKFASTHLDGNFKGFLPFIRETGFDLLDGCTPAPMFNYEVEELAAALAGAEAPSGRRMRCYCGVPAGLLTIGLPTREITSFGERIVKAFAAEVIVNVGDILPPTGDIEQVIALGEAVRGTALRGGAAAMQQKSQ